MGRRDLDDGRLVKERIKKREGEEKEKKIYGLRDRTTSNTTCAGKCHKLPGAAVPF